MIMMDGDQCAQYMYSGLFVSANVWIHPRRVIDTYEIILMLEGIAYIQQEEEQFVLEKGDVLLLRPGMLHFGFRESRERVSFYWLHFTGDPPFLPGDFVRLREPYAAASLFKQLLHTANTPGYERCTADLYTALIISQIRFEQNGRSVAVSGLARQVYEWIRNNADRNISVKEAAKHFGYNENYISKLFKRSFQVGMKEFIAGEKMKLAKSLLITTNDSVKQIAYALHFGDENLFVKFFTYHEGVSPAKYRNTYFNTHMNQK